MRVKYKRYGAFRTEFWSLETIEAFLAAWMIDVDLPERDPCFGDPPR